MHETKTEKKPYDRRDEKASRILITPLVMTIPVPAVAIAAPARLERMAWLEDVGSPKCQAIRSHIMAERSAEMTVTWVTEFFQQVRNPLFWHGSPCKCPGNIAYCCDGHGGCGREDPC
jgi:hypothetical protein